MALGYEIHTQSFFHFRVEPLNANVYEKNKRSGLGDFWSVG